MTKISRKLVLSLLTVVLTVVALGTTTFAWFTLTNTATVQPFEAEIVGDTGIEIALGSHSGVYTAPNSYTWKTTITTADIYNYIETTAFTTFGHVTTANGLAFRTLGTGALTDTSLGYLDIPLSFRSNSANRIDWTSVSLSSDPYTWTIDANFSNAAGTYVTTPGTQSVDASNGMRIAMFSSVDYGTYMVGYEKPAVDGNIVMGAGPHDFTGTMEDPDGISDSGDEYLSGNADGAVSYFYAKNDAYPAEYNNVELLPTITDLGVDGQPVTDLIAVDATTFGADYFGQVTIRVWLEGWDANTYNSILSQIIETSFSFTGVTVTPVTP